MTLAQISHQQATPHICRSKGKSQTIKRTFRKHPVQGQARWVTQFQWRRQSQKKAQCNPLGHWNRSLENALAWEEAESQHAEVRREPLYCGGRSKHSHTSHMALRTKFQLAWPQPATSTHLHWHFHATPKSMTPLQHEDTECGRQSQSQQKGPCIADPLLLSPNPEPWDKCLKPSKP